MHISRSIRNATPYRKAIAAYGLYIGRRTANDVSYVSSSDWRSRRETRIYHRGRLRALLIPRRGAGDRFIPRDPARRLRPRSVARLLRGAGENDQRSAMDRMDRIVHGDLSDLDTPYHAAAASVVSDPSRISEKLERTPRVTVVGRGMTPPSPRSNAPGSRRCPRLLIHERRRSASRR